VKLRRTILIAALAAGVLSQAPAARSAVDGCERACTIRAANAYLAALVSHDGSDVPFHENAWRQENGGTRLEGAENIRAGLASPIMYVITGIQDLRWFVDGDDAMAVYFLDTVAPTYIFERFRVDDDGLITEVDAHFYIDIPGHVVGPESVATNPQRRVDAIFRSSHGPAGPVPVKAGDEGDTLGGSPTEDDVAGAVDAFLLAMETGDTAGVELAPDATQTINHRVIEDIEANLASSAQGIASIPDPAVGDPLQRYLQVDGNQATVLYHLMLHDGSVLYTASRFEVVDGRIVDIETVCDGAELCTGPPPAA
jgi:hypothetical protein